MRRFDSESTTNSQLTSHSLLYLPGPFDDITKTDFLELPIDVCHEGFKILLCSCDHWGLFCLTQGEQGAYHH